MKSVRRAATYRQYDVQYPTDSGSALGLKRVDLGLRPWVCHNMSAIARASINSSAGPTQRTWNKTWCVTQLGVMVAARDPVLFNPR